MKYGLFSFLFSMILPLGAQDIHPEKPAADGKFIHSIELGINVYNMTDLSRYQYGIFPYSYTGKFIHKQFFNGISGYYHRSKVTYRFTYDGFNQSFSFHDWGSGNNFYDSGIRKSRVVRVGIQKYWGSEKFKVYVGSDLVCRQQNISGHSWGWGDFGGPFDYYYNSTIYEAGLDFALGLKYQFLRRFSVSAETTGQMQLLDFKYNPYSQLSPLFTSFNPLRMLSVSYRFGQ